MPLDLPRGATRHGRGVLRAPKAPAEGGHHDITRPAAARRAQGAEGARREVWDACCARIATRRDEIRAAPGGCTGENGP